MFDRTVWIVRAPAAERDPMGNRRPDWTRATRTPWRYVNVQPAADVSTSAERTDTTGRPRTQLTNSWKVFGAPGSGDIDITALDRLAFAHAGPDYEIQGQPSRWPDPLYPGVTHHVEVLVQEIAG